MEIVLIALQSSFRLQKLLCGVISIVRCFFLVFVLVVDHELALFLLTQLVASRLARGPCSQSQK